MSKLPIQSSLYQEKATYFAEVILPVPVAGTFTYRVPESVKDIIAAGMRVIAPFGRKKLMTGVVLRVHEEAPKDFEAKMLLDVLDETPSCTALQLKAFQWIADYYLSSLGEVLNVGVPAGLKLHSESYIQLYPGFQSADSPYIFSTPERQLLEFLEHNPLIPFSEALAFGQEPGQTSRIIKSLLQKRAVLLVEQVQERYKPRTEKFVRLQKEWNAKAALEQLMEELEKREKQLEIILRYLQHVPVFSRPELNTKGLPKKAFKDLSDSALKTLEKNGVLESFEQVVSRLEGIGEATAEAPEMSEAQQRSYEEIHQAFTHQDVVLLHGITGSGKTALYIHLIEEAMANGEQVLYLLPEIALTTQIVQRLKAHFGSQMGIYHSKYSDNERVETWNGLLDGQFQLIVGVRSSVLLPFESLGLIIVDEEHENSYKQFDPAPRYHARDVAVMLGNLHHAKVLLGSATPSFESYYNAQHKKYGYVHLPERYGSAQLPEIKLVDVLSARKRKEMQEDFSPTLLEAIKARLERKEQVILFQNRRGYAPLLQCGSCGWTPTCDNCSVSLTYHMHFEELRCHYCGYKQKTPYQCPECQSTDLKLMGFGTEKIEDSLKQFFPEARVQRMDLDTTRKKFSYQQIIDRFAHGDVDILVGTQMVTKGLDFDKVSLVGILDVDRLFLFPDFRATERAYQLITQVSGRAGRKDKAGEVLLQTRTPEAPFFQRVLAQDFQAFYQQEMRERQEFYYPPFCRLIKISFRDKDVTKTQKAAQAFYQELVAQQQEIVILPPHEPMISKIRNYFIQEVLIKLPKTTQLKNQKLTLRKVAEHIGREKAFKSVRIIFDVDAL